MTRILAIETATEACSAALLVDGELLERFELAPQQHAQLILPMAEALLGEAGLTLNQLDAVGLGRGPGSFTGVRIATGVAQGIAFGAGLPVVPVSSLAAMAQAGVDATEWQRVLAAFDARMGQVYWGAYAADGDGLVTLVGTECVCAPEAVPLPETMAWLAAGSGWATYTDVLRDRLGERVTTIDRDAMPRAGAVARLAEKGLRSGAAVPPEQAAPVYLRDQVAAKPRPR